MTEVGGGGGVRGGGGGLCAWEKNDAVATGRCIVKETINTAKQQQKKYTEQNSSVGLQVASVLAISVYNEIL